ncbi:MAG TPA: hypothetical protein VH413_06995 [Verrucomicrobiae bacterium]|jgi:hypothetical protein|nr:hypothetical protein [Verrucomicrobiae bacterium]
MSVQNADAFLASPAIAYPYVCVVVVKAHFVTLAWRNGGQRARE